MPKRKKSRTLSTMSHKSVLAAEKSHYGEEPDFTDSIDAGCKRIRAFDADGNPDTELAYLKALNWYNACGNDTQYPKWIVEYAKNTMGLSTQQIAPLKKLNTNRVDRTIAINARIISRCAVNDSIVPEPMRVKVSNEVVRLLAGATVQTKLNPPTPEKPSKPSVQEYMSIAAGNFFGDVVEPLIDEIFESGGKQNKAHDLYNLLTKHEIKGRVALKVAERILPTIEEINNAIDGDADYKEAYDFLTTSQKKKVYAKLVAFVEDCERINDMAKKSRKTTTRKRKTPSAAKLLKGFKYKEKDDEFKIASVDPKKIIGASSVVLFNTKNRKATWICAEDKAGLNIKGASITGFDPKTSVQKTVRKPMEFIATTNGKGKRAIKNMFDRINAKNSFANGKVNSHTVVLTVVK